ncbi:hypothetical protein ACFVTX_16270 [Agromyces sp. NPDC058136]|uniref:hypothetical protein n=1 Tax=Agromyces sp. NPDC058136 TaxID=3346354 RepID=UPI0036D8719C
MLGIVGMVIGAALLAFSSAFGLDHQREPALLVAAVGASAAIAGVSLVCIALVLRSRRTTLRPASRGERRHVPAVHRATVVRPVERDRPALTGEQPMIAS